MKCLPRTKVIHFHFMGGGVDDEASFFGRGRVRGHLFDRVLMEKVSYKFIKNIGHIRSR